MTAAQPWEPQPDESAPAFEAFTIYRDLGPLRSATKTARQLGKSPSLMQRWAIRHTWSTRARAWDTEQDRLWRQQQNTTRRDMARRHARIAVAVQAKVVARLQALDPQELSPHELMRWLNTAVSIERHAYAIGGPQARDSGPIDTHGRDLNQAIRGELTTSNDRDDGL
ncbi:hypothetical protein [Streptomyces lavendofoliae]|uniref:Terminase small subunit n=1 Tax=Streptomyces lavendofoliae TaxID=67314 RepID=A0A918I0H7_9ACTN|nr:hypothetical protein [Streptomyces lavendofoliae]GGU50408.1 hypothetical protein GCM10010274_43910 [Streptomyces lavendofoliae]